MPDDAERQELPSPATAAITWFHGHGGPRTGSSPLADAVLAATPAGRRSGPEPSTGPRSASVPTSARRSACPWMPVRSSPIGRPAPAKAISSITIERAGRMGEIRPRCHLRHTLRRLDAGQGCPEQGGTRQDSG
ncbi:hypothetical protein [Azospirillum agricola]|uniref:hypothetical protein n=1 Tax=Azospirillum agricola TaxID=1720247 RepID=UPI001AE11A31